MSAGETSSNDALLREVVALRSQVSELKRARARGDESDDTSLREREDLLNEVERAAQLGTWNWDLATNEVKWSDQLYRILGLEPGSTPALVERYYAALHPEDRIRAEQSQAKGVVDGMLPPFDARLVRPDGSIRFTTSWSSAIFGADGSPRRFVGAVLDRTESVKTEAELRRTLELLRETQRIAQVGSYRYVPSTGLIEWSAGFRRIFGFDQSVSPSVEMFLSCIHPDDRSMFEEASRRNHEAPQAAVHDARVLRPNGEVRHVRFSSEVFDESGVPEIRGAILDTTDQVRMREELAQSQKMEAIGRLSAGIAHDFNNLLTVVSGNIELLRYQAGPSQELEECLHALDSAKQLTSRLLAFGRKARLSLRNIDPNELVSSTLDLLRRLIGDQVGLSLSLTPGLGAVRVDPVEIERALVNLVVNARDATVDGGIVTIATGATTFNGREAAEISVRDEGPGIPERELPHIFEPFYTTRSDSGGTGLGLSTVMGTADQHGGTVRVDSRLGEGSVFSLILPIVSGPSRESFKPASVSQIPRPSNLHVLVVDDEPRVSDVTAKMLEVLGHRVEVVHTPEAALTIWANQTTAFDLVICDIAMPSMRGTTLVKRLAEVGPEPRVLFITGYSDEATDQTRDHLVLAKPFLVAALNKAIDEVME